MSEPVQVRVDRAPARCPVCHDELGGEEELVACRDCGARHHGGCWGENEKCATCGSERALGEGGAVAASGARASAEKERSAGAVIYGCGLAFAWTMAIVVMRRGDVGEGIAVIALSIVLALGLKRHFKRAS